MAWALLGWERRREAATGDDRRPLVAAAGTAFAVAADVWGRKPGAVAAQGSGTCGHSFDPLTERETLDQWNALRNHPHWRTLNFFLQGRVPVGGNQPTLPATHSPGGYSTTTGHRAAGPGYSVPETITNYGDGGRLIYLGGGLHTMMASVPWAEGRGGSSPPSRSTAVATSLSGGQGFCAAAGAACLAGCAPCCGPALGICAGAWYVCQPHP